ncbi:MAG: SDR family oxidoreductase [Nitrososphaeraceae archaeon]
MNTHSKNTQNRTAIITGSGRGIGKETAIILARQVKNIVVCSRTKNEINEVVKEIREMNGHVNVLGQKCDVSISSQVNSLVRSIVDRFGGESIDILVNNAGVAFDKKLVDTTEDDWDQTINTNLKGAFLITKAIIPHMIQRKSGTILNVNSGAGKTGFSDLSSYCASKFGLAGLAESLSLEVKMYNIRVMTIFLGQVSTRMWQDYDYDYYEKNKDNMLGPKNVAARIVEMILDSQKYKNGDSVEMYYP